MKDGFNPMHRNIVTECYADTLLVELLGFKKPNHQFGINQVLTVVSKIKLPKVVGIIDDDKKKTSKLLNDFEIVENIGELQLRKLKTEDKHLILLKPAFEKWIFRQAEKVSVPPEQYGFKNVKAFGSNAKSQYVHKNEKIKAFLNTLKQKNPSGFKQLKNWISKYK